jgi:hypothetical protein
VSGPMAHNSGAATARPTSSAAVTSGPANAI